MSRVCGNGHGSLSAQELKSIMRGRGSVKRDAVTVSVYGILERSDDGR